MVTPEPAKRRDLPDYRNPPVTEVALSVAFEPLRGYTSAHGGVFWGRISDRYPRAEEQGPMLTPEELPEPETSKGSPIVLGKLPFPRLWLLNADGTELIQLQQNSFTRNWRQTENQPYPRYEELRERFLADLQLFTTFVVEKGLGDVVPRQCEVTYVNQIIAGEGWRDFSEMDKVIAGCSKLEGATLLKRPEEVRYASRYAIQDDRGQFLGRLTVAAEPALRRQDRKPIIQLTLTVRGKAIGAGSDGILAFLDIGRNWIVRGFTDITTREMHAIWGRTQ